VTDWRPIHRTQYGRQEEVRDGVPVEPYKEHTVVFLVQVHSAVRHRPTG
jgi:hypothetical protein